MGSHPPGNLGTDSSPPFMPRGIPWFTFYLIDSYISRNAKAAKHDFSHMYQYLERVNEVMAAFEEQLWGHFDNFMDLGQDNPTLLVDCLRIVELQVWSLTGGFVTWIIIWRGTERMQHGCVVEDHAAGRSTSN